VAGGKGSRSRPRPRARASTALSFPRARSGSGLELAKIAPSGRSLLIGLLILLTALGLYAAARGTSAFAVRTMAVEGASPPVAADVRKQLSPALGESLLGLDLAELQHRPRRADGGLRVVRPSVPARAIAIVGDPVAVLRRGILVVARRRRWAGRRRARPRCAPGLREIWLSATSGFSSVRP
jgi:hypothetical protein